MLLNTPFSLIIEGPIDNGDGIKRMPPKVIECGCIIIDDGQGPRLLVKSAFDLCRQCPIDDEQDLPTIQTIKDAAVLAEWCEQHQ